MSETKRTFEEYLGKDLAGFKLVYCFALAIDENGLMPATYGPDKTPVIVMLREQAEEIEKLLPNRTHHINEEICLVNEEEGVVYRFASVTMLERAERESYLSRDRIDALLAADPHPFHWPL